MSTKIHNGYYIEECSVYELNEIMISFMEDARGVFKDIFLKKTGKFIAQMIDAYDLGELDGEEYYLDKKIGKSFTPYRFIRELFQERHNEINQTGIRAPDYDLECSVCVIPHKKSGKLLCLFYSEADDYLAVWNKIDEIKEYKYYNNVDPPKNITDEEWETRGAIWNDALEYRAPKDRGFVYELLGGNILTNISYDDCKKIKFPTLEERANEYAKNEFSRRYVLGKQFESGGVFIANHKFFGALNEATQEMETEEGKKNLKKITEEIKIKLRENITINEANKHFSIKEKE